MNSVDVALVIALLLVGSVSSGAAWLILNKLSNIHSSVDGNLSKVKSELAGTSQALIESRIELSAARRDIEFLKAQMLQAGGLPVINRMRKSGAKR